MKNNENKVRPFDPAEMERKAAMYERWAAEDTSPEFRKYHANKAKHIRRMLAFMERAGWNKRSGAVSTEMPKDNIEVR